MFTFTYTAAFLAILFGVSAAFLLHRYRGIAVAQALSFELLAGALWVGANAGADVAYTPAMNIFWSGLALIGGLFMLSCFLIFADTFVDNALPKRPRLALYLLPSVLMSLFAFSKYSIVETLFPPNAPSAIVPGILYQFYLIFFAIAVGFGLSRLIPHYRGARGKTRRQTAHILAGFACFFAGIITFNVLLPLGGEVRFFNVGPQFAALFFLFTSYAIFKHQLISIRILIQRGLIYSILLSFIIAGYAVLLVLLEQILHAGMGTAEPIAAALTIFLGLYTIPHLERFFRKLTDPIFFKGLYDYSKSLKELSDILNKSIELRQLAERALEKLSAILHATHVEFETVNGLSISQTAGGHARGPSTLTIPIRLDENIIGHLRLGEKLSGDPYTKKDLILLRTFASQAAVAIQKAKLYQELKEYSLDLERKVRERTIHLEQLHRSQREMLDEISHELQNPLALIKISVETLRHDPQDVKNHLSIIEHSVDILSRLVSNLLRLARMDTEEKAATPVRFNLCALVKKVIEYTAVACREHGITLTASVERNVSFTGQQYLIEELITNLLSNAVKYTATSPARRIHVELKKSADTVEIFIKDTGIGIVKGDLPHIFERFYRARANGVHRGTGLGLAIAKKIAVQHGGELRAESEGLGKGSTFTLTLPI